MSSMGQGRKGGGGPPLLIKSTPSPPRHPHSFLIGEDGLVYEGRGWDTKGDHTGKIWNPISIGISFMGNYMGECPAAGTVGRPGIWDMVPHGMWSLGSSATSKLCDLRK